MAYPFHLNSPVFFMLPNLDFFCFIYSVYISLVSVVKNTIMNYWRFMVNGNICSNDTQIALQNGVNSWIIGIIIIKRIDSIKMLR